MRIALVGSGASIHVRQWATELSRNGHQVMLATRHAMPSNESLPGDIEVVRIGPAGPAGYVLGARALARAVRRFRPDVVQAHYATGYGTLARLSRCRPLVISVWGQDVYEFPDKSRFHRWLVRSNLRHADRVTSTSEVMRTRTLVVLGPHALDIAVVPFGVDVQRFSPRTEARPAGPVRIGTVKWLEDKYGVDDLIRAGARAVAAGLDIEVLIAGDGSAKARLEALAAELGMTERVRFLGRLPHHEVPDCLRSMDVYLALSTVDSESFGVAAIEAGACGIPVVVSDVGGLPEVVLDEVTGFVTPRRDPEAAARRVIELATDAALRAKLGGAGRQHVIDTYAWERCVERLTRVLDDVVAQHTGPHPAH